MSREVIKVDDVYTNIIDEKGLSVNYQIVKNWYDGTSMDSSKVDNYLYAELENGSFVRRVIDKDGELFLEKDTMLEIKNLNSREILCLKAGVYKGVKLNGYYEGQPKYDKPLYYFLSDTDKSEDKGSIIVAEGIKLEHKFEIADLTYFGYPNIDTDRLSLILNRFPKIVYPSGKGKLILEKEVNITLNNIEWTSDSLDFKTEISINSYAGHMFDVTSNNAYISNIIFNGDNLAEWGLVVRGDNPKITNNTFTKFYGTTKASAGLLLPNVHLYKIDLTSIIDNIFDDISAVTTGSIGEGVGSSRGVYISATNAIYSGRIKIYRNLFNNITGREGDAIQLLNSTYAGSSKYMPIPVEISYNSFNNFNRRGVKIQSSNAIIYDNVFKNSLTVTSSPNLYACIETIYSDDIIVQDNDIDATNVPYAVNIQGNSTDIISNVSVFLNDIKSGVNTSSTWASSILQRAIIIAHASNTNCYNNEVRNGSEILFRNITLGSIANNTMHGTYNSTLVCKGIVVENTCINVDVVDNRGVDSIGSAIYFIDYNGKNGTIRGNSVSYPPTVRNYSVVNLGSSSEKNNIENNISTCTNFVAINSSSTKNFIGQNNNTSGSLSGSGKIFYVTAKPTLGIFAVGDIALITNSSPNTNPYIGWACTTRSNSAGTGSVWKEIGFFQQAAHSANTATLAVGATPTKAEFDALLNELRDVKTKLRTGNIMASS